MNNYLRNLKRNGAIYLATGAFAFNGCYDTQNNRAPQLILREAKTQQVVNATDERHIVNSESTYDKLYLIPMTRESLEQGLEQYIIEATDSDGPWPISGNFYTAQNRQLNPLQIHITEGRNTSESLSWTITLEPDQEETIPLGTYLVAEGSVSDGDKKRTVGLYGIIGRENDSPITPPNDGGNGEPDAILAEFVDQRGNIIPSITATYQEGNIAIMYAQLTIPTTLVPSGGPSVTWVELGDNPYLRVIPFGEPMLKHEENGVSVYEASAHLASTNRIPPVQATTPELIEVRFDSGLEDLIIDSIEVFAEH